MAASGMTGIILTAKHHDSFCLWPSKHTDYTLASSPYKNGQGDIAQEVAEACKKHKLKFGVYLSPWDRTEATYGQGEAYDDFFVNQLEELLTNYGDVFSVWFDGANGEGPNGKVQHYELNVPPMANGLLHENDITVLKGLGEKITSLYEMNALEAGEVTFSSNPQSISKADLMDFSLDHAYWVADRADENPTLEVEWAEAQRVNTIILGEQIKEGQILEHVSFYVKYPESDWTELVAVHSIGYLRIIEFETQAIVGLRIHFNEYRSNPNLNHLSITLLEDK